jgi:SulP family sulfate permease
MAGVIIMLLGLFRFGGVIKFVPYPVTAGFTAGIGVTILASQVKDFFGLTILTADGHPASIPADFVGKLELFSRHWGSFGWHAMGIGLGSLLVLTLMRRIAPRVPATIVAVGLAAVATHFFGWSRTHVAFDGTHLRPLVETIGTRFGGIPSKLPSPHIPAISWQMVRELIPSASAIAFLGAIESLLSAVVADGMTGYRHRSDQELVAQGFSNIVCALFYGLPATGAIARTAANVRSGGRSPIAGMLHAVFILLFMLALSPLAKAVPLPSLAAILVVVAWKVSDLQHFRSLLRGPGPDVLVLLTTFGLTVFFDLTIAVGTGILLASILFMRRMAQVTTVTGLSEEIEEGAESEAADPKDPGKVADRRIPDGIEVYEVNGPFFFGVANNLRDALDQIEKPPKVLILRMRYVPHIDATGLNALREFHRRCVNHGTILLLGGVHAHPLFEMVKAGMDQQIGLERIFDNLDEALVAARKIVRQAEAGSTLSSPAPSPETPDRS